MKTQLILLSVIILPGMVLGQGLAKKAINEFENYSNPIVAEKKDGKNKTTTETQRKIAETHKLSGNYVLAEKMYANIITSNDKTEEDIYAYAQILKMNGKYAEARYHMNIFSILTTDDIRAKLFSENTTYANELLKDNGQFKIKHLKSNSAQQDFGVTYYKDQVVFTSSRCNNLSATLHHWTAGELPYLDLYIGKIDAKSEICKTKKLAKFNKKYHEGPATYSKDGNIVMYTEDNYKAKSSD